MVSLVQARHLHGYADPLTGLLLPRLRVLWTCSIGHAILRYKHKHTHQPSRTQYDRGRPLPAYILLHTHSHSSSGTVRRGPLPSPLFCLLSYLTFSSQAMASAVANVNASAKPMTDKEITRHRVMARLSEIRTQPLKQLPMTVFMMWMVGNEVSIFSIMFVGMAVVNPLQSILSAGKLFADFEEDSKADRQIRSAVNQARWIYIGCCLVAFLVALVKLNWMELLPVSSMDWMDNTPPTYQELSSGVFYH